MGVSMKAGSVLRVPVLAGWTASSSDSSIVTAIIQANVLTITAKSPGNAKISLAPASDLSASLSVTVTPN